MRKLKEDKLIRRKKKERKEEKGETEAENMRGGDEEKEMKSKELVRHGMYKQ